MTGPRKPEQHQRALALRLDGHSYAEIGRAMGTSRQNVQQLIRPDRATRARIHERASGACEGCRSPLERAGEIHHRQARGMTPETYNADENLTLLCHACHMAAHADPAKKARLAARKANRQEAWAKGALKRAAKMLDMSFEEYEARREAGEKWCTWHKTWESADLFVTLNGRPGYICRQGNQEQVRQRQGIEYQRDYRARNRDRLNAYRREWVKRRRAS